MINWLTDLTLKYFSGSFFTYLQSKADSCVRHRSSVRHKSLAWATWEEIGEQKPYSREKKIKEEKWVCWNTGLCLSIQFTFRVEKSEADCLITAPLSARDGNAFGSRAVFFSFMFPIYLGKICLPFRGVSSSNRVICLAFKGGFSLNCFVKSHF